VGERRIQPEPIPEIDGEEIECRQATLEEAPRQRIALLGDPFGTRLIRGRHHEVLASAGLVDPFAVVLFFAPAAVMLWWRAAPVKMAADGAVLGLVRRRLAATWGV
jgi:hypothetical protein